jgi:hypothetical protein
VGEKLSLSRDVTQEPKPWEWEVEVEVDHHRTSAARVHACSSCNYMGILIYSPHSWHQGQQHEAMVRVGRDCESEIGHGSLVPCTWPPTSVPMVSIFSCAI